MMNEIRKQAIFSQLNKMTKRELYEYVRDNVQEGNNRLGELENVDANTSAYRYVRQKGFVARSGIENIGQFTVFKEPSMSMERYELLSEAQNLTGFLNAKTSTIEGRDSMYQQAIETLVKNSQGKIHNITVEQAEQIFTSEVFKNYSEIANMSTVVLEVFSQNLDKGRSFERIEKVLQKYFDKKAMNGSDLSEKSLNRYLWGRHIRHSSKIKK